MVGRAGGGRTGGRWSDGRAVVEGASMYRLAFLHMHAYACMYVHVPIGVLAHVCICTHVSLPLSLSRSITLSSFLSLRPPPGSFNLPESLSKPAWPPSRHIYTLMCGAAHEQSERGGSYRGPTRLPDPPTANLKVRDGQKHDLGRFRQSNAVFHFFSAPLRRGYHFGEHGLPRVGVPAEMRYPPEREKQKRKKNSY